MKLHPLAGSLLAATFLATASVAGATALTSASTVVPGAQPVKFSVVLPLRNTAAMKALLVAQQTKGSPSYHQWLKPAQVAAQFGPTAATMSQVQAALTAAGFQVTATHIRSIDVVAPAATINKSLQITLRSLAGSNGGARIITTNRVIVPQSLASAGATIPTFANVPEHKAASTVLGAAPANRNGPAGGYNYNDLKQAYDYPSYGAIDGTGVHVGIVMEDDAANSDVAAEFNHEHYTTTTGKAPPTYNYIPIDGGGSFGGGGTFEAELDVQMALGGAPGATVDLLSTPNLSDQSIIDAYNYIVDSGAYDVVSSSFGECELFYTPAYNNGYDFTGTLAYYDEIFQIGNLEGTTFLASSGDEAGVGCPSQNIVPHFYANIAGPQVNFIKGASTPAADPNVTAVGGGNLVTSYTPGSLQSTYVGENGFGDPEVPYDEFGIGVDIYGGYWGPGGGPSSVFAKPAYQSLVNTKASTRALPDIGMLVGGCPGGISVLPCGPDRAYVVVTVGGTRYGLIGTSVSSPEFAGAVALAVQYNGGRFGNLNNYLYAQSAVQIAAGGSSAPAASQFYHMNISGYDGAFTTSPTTGYNYIYGNGSPDVRNLFGMSALPAAGTPRSPSNP